MARRLEGRRSSLMTVSRPLGQRQAVFELLQARDFKLLWVGQLFSQIGDNCLLVAAITLISSLSSSPLAILIPALSLVIPQVIFGMVGGVMADRWDRKTVMIASDVLRGLIVLSFLLVRSAGQLWILCLAAASLAAVGVFFYPARNAAIPNLVPQGLLLTANGLIQSSYIIALIVGPLIAGVAVELWMPAAIMIDSASFFFSAATIAVMRIPRSVQSSENPHAAGQGTVWQDMKVGLDFIRRNGALREVLTVTAVAMLGIGAIALLAIPHLKEQLGATGLEYGLALSMLGIGSVLGGMVVSRVSRRLSASTTVGSMLVLAGGAIIAFACITNYGVVLASLACIGLCIVVARGSLDTITQALSPDSVRGRVQAAVNLIIASSTALAEGLAATFGSLFGVQAMFVAAGVITALTGMVSVFLLRSVARLIGHGMVMRVQD